MRKLVIALIIVLPMVFVLVLFSSANLVSISVKVSVNGIQLFKDGDPLPEGEAIYLDMAEMKDHTVKAEVTPANASEKGYMLESDNEDVLQVSKVEDNAEGEKYKIIALKEGTVNVKATSKDKGYTASVPVVVTSSKAYDVAFSLYNTSDGKAVPMTYHENTSTYTVEKPLDAGTYTYKVDIEGGDSKAYTLKAEDEIKAIINEGDESIMLPFSGSVSLKLEVPDAIKDGMKEQTLKRTINIDIAKAQSTSGIIVNGVPDGNTTVLLAKGADKATMYVECKGEPELTGEGIASVRCLVHGTSTQPQAMSADENTRAASDNYHKLEITLKDNIVLEQLQATLKTAAGNSAQVNLSFADFDFNLRAPIMHGQAGAYDTVILNDTPTTIYAVPAVSMQDVEYEWTANNDALSINYTKDKSASCVFNATKDGEYDVTVQAKHDGKELGAPKQLKVTVTTKVSSVRIINTKEVDLAECYTVGGKKFAENGEIVDNDGYAIRIMVMKKSKPHPNDYEGIEVVSSNEEIASVTMRDGMACLDIKGDGAIEVTARWKYNEEFGGKATNTIKLNVVKDAVEVSNYPDLRTATENGHKVVLTSDIMLGSDKNGQELSLEERQQIAAEHKYKSTYNTEFYNHDANRHPEEAYVKYAIEFTNDVYGNGKNIDAEYISNSMDASGTPNIFMDPLVFVEYRGIAAVRGQDNCAFLIRTDGVKLYGVNLLGCSDDSLNDDTGNYELNKLNKIGTTLEINADCEIINCRIRNGRNVVRVYGGNRNGENYFVDSLTKATLTAEEQIEVKIEGCIITQGREFLVKVGANKALRANSINGQEPSLKDETGKAYKETNKTNNYAVGEYEKGSYFYTHYVMTDLTLKDTVLETSGLFCVGVESNFSGAMLFEGAESIMTGDSATYATLTKTWRYSGGTSFASILRLEGDVRTYDWKDVAQVDSSTLIEATGTTPLSELMKFDVSSLLKEVDGKPDYAKLMYRTEDNKTYVHGGIAFYGGGRNYSQIVINMDGSLGNLQHLSINVGQFVSSDNAIVKRQAQLLPYAAGTHDFNFWLYAADSDNNYEKQESDIANGTKYTGVTKVPLFSE